MAFFDLIHTDTQSCARAGVVHTDHGDILTPIFMPVGTVGTVKGVQRHDLEEDINAQIYIAGAKEKEGKLYTSGGRVLAVTSIAETLKKAIEKSYKEVEKITFKNAHYRRDIGAKCIN